MPAYLLGAGVALPGKSVPQNKTAELALSLNGLTAQRKKFLRAVYGQVAIDERYSVLSQDVTRDVVSFEEFFKGGAPGTGERMRRFEAWAPALAHRAAEEALAKADRRAGDIGHLVSVSCTGFSAPGFDISVLKSLGLPASVSRTHIGFMGCHGALNGLRAASAYCAAPEAKDALLVSVELCSLHYSHGKSRQELLGNALFADGAAAAVISSRPGPGGSWKIAAQGSWVVPDSEDAITWRVGDAGFEMGLSPGIPKLVQTDLKPWLESWLSESGLTTGDIRTWAIHPGGPGVLSAVETALRLKKEALEVSRKILRLSGNMSSAALLFILQEHLRQKSPAPCLALGFGPGLTFEAALFL